MLRRPFHWLPALPVKYLGKNQGVGGVGVGVVLAIAVLLLVLVLTSSTTSCSSSSGSGSGVVVVVVVVVVRRRGAGHMIQTKQKCAGREQRNKYEPRTETGTTPSNQTLWQAGGLLVFHVCPVHKCIHWRRDHSRWTPYFVMCTEKGYFAEVTSPMTTAAPPASRVMQVKVAGEMKWEQRRCIPRER